MCLSYTPILDLIARIKSQWAHARPRRAWQTPAFRDVKDEKYTHFVVGITHLERARTLVLIRF